MTAAGGLVHKLAHGIEVPGVAPVADVVEVPAASMDPLSGKALGPPPGDPAASTDVAGLRLTGDDLDLLAGPGERSRPGTREAVADALRAALAQVAPAPVEPAPRIRPPEAAPDPQATLDLVQQAARELRDDDRLRIGCERVHRRIELEISHDRAVELRLLRGGGAPDAELRRALVARAGRYRAICRLFGWCERIGTDPAPGA